MLDSPFRKKVFQLAILENQFICDTYHVCVVLELGYFIDFFRKGMQDPLSVALSLTREEIEEERVKVSVNEMLEEYVWSRD